MKNAKWIGRAVGEIQPMTGNPLDNIKDRKDEINEVRASLLLRKVFNVSGIVKKATMKVCGLGYYTVKINGEKPDEDVVLAPLLSDFRENLYYDEYDVTDLIKPDSNVLLIELGTGYYAAPKKRWDWRLCWYGNVRAIACLEIECVNGDTIIVTTDNSFKMHDGAVLESCVYDGEKYDARKMPTDINCASFDDSAWDNAVVVECPTKNMKKRMAEPIKICKRYVPCKSWEVSTGTLYDFGENRTGWVKIQVSGNAGDKVSIRFCERIFDNGEPDYETNRGADVLDEYILSGNDIETYAPQFTFHGFKYALVTKSSASIKVHSVVQEHFHSDVKVTGVFESDNLLLNKIHRACTLTQLNGFMGLPIDCPQRDERMGWLGDAHVTAQMGVYNFDLLEFYRKWLTDIRIDCADNGEVPHIAPWPQRKEPSPVDWSSGYLIIALATYKMYGDKSIIEEHYDSFKKYMDYLYDISDNYILPQGRYGDWSSSLEGFTRGEPFYDNTMFYYYTLKITKECAEILGNLSDAKLYEEKLSEMKKRCIDLYYDKTAKSFGDGTQFSNGMALFIGLVPDEDREEVVETLIARIKKDGGLVAGIFGAQYVLDVLRQFDRGDVVVDIMTKEEYPSWGYMVSKSTTITENWSGEGYASQNHCMLGSVDAQMFMTLGGLDVDMSKSYVKIRPYITDKCKYVKVKEETVKGDIISQWHNNTKDIIIEVVIPDGITADFEVSKLNMTDDMTFNGNSFDGKTVLKTGYNNIVIRRG